MQQAFLKRFDLYGDVAGVNPTVGKASAYEPQSLLICTAPHVVHFAIWRDAPNRANLLSHLFT
jgi:hypothetical protein